jgi:DNA-binding beta-propeller fold protein YncE
VRAWRAIARAACAGALLAAGACGAPAPADRPAKPSADLPSWPGAPQAARIRYLRSVSGPADWGVHKSAFGRILGAISGKKEERFVRPTGVAAMGDTVYVADPGASAVWVLDAKQNQYAKVREIAGQALTSPVAVAVRPDGGIYVADSVLKAVLLLSRDLKSARIVARQGLEQPVGLAFDPAIERLFVADAASHRVLMYDPRDRLVGVAGAGGSEVSEFNRPTHLALDHDGTLMVTDALNFRVQAIDRGGRFVRSFGQHGDGTGDLAAPKGLAVDRAGDVYLVDALFDAVQIFDPHGTLLLAFGEHGIGPGQFWLPNGIFIDSSDRIFVADSYNRRIQVFDVIPGTDEGHTQ